ncbi:MAG: AsmA family protein [Nitrospinae bacterium]|nr:AsmA family protein [Nitrospinota bacterium]
MSQQENDIPEESQKDGDSPGEDRPLGDFPGRSLFESREEDQTLPDFLQGEGRQDNDFLPGGADEPSPPSDLADLDAWKEDESSPEEALETGEREPDEGPEELLEEEPEEFQPREPEKKKSPLGRLVKGFFLTLLALAVLLAGAGLGMNYVFPPEKLRPIIERELSKALNVPVAIGELSVNILHGIEIQNARIGGGEPLLSVRSLVLDYDLAQLFKGQLTVNKIVVDQPSANLVSTQGVWNFQPLLSKDGKPREPPQKKEGPALALPFQVDLKQFALNNVKLEVRIDDRTLARLEGLNVQAQAQALAEDLNLSATVALAPLGAPGPQHNLTFFSRSRDKNLEVRTALTSDIKIVARNLNQVDVTGRLQAAQNKLFMGRDLPSPDLGGEWDLSLSLKPEQVKVRRFLLNAGKNNQAEFSGEVQNYTARPDFNLTLRNANFDIGEILEWGGKAVKPLKAQGTLRIADISVTGQAPGQRAAGPNGLDSNGEAALSRAIQAEPIASGRLPGSIEARGGSVVLEDFAAADPRLKANVEGARLAAELQELKLENSVPQSLAFKAKLSANKGGVGNLAFSRLDQTLEVSSEGSSLEMVRATVSSSADLEFRHPKLGKIQTDFRLDGAAEGNLPLGDLNVVKLDLGVGPFLKGSGHGKVGEFGKKEVLFDQSLDLDLAHFKKFLPPDILKKSGLVQLAGTMKADVHFQGNLDKNLRPQKGSAKANLALAGVDLQTGDPAVNVKNLSAQAVLPMEFVPARGIKAQAMDISLRFQKLEALKNWELASGEAQARVSTDKLYAPGAAGILPVTQHASFKADAVNSRDPELRISGVKLESDLRTDLYPEQNDARNTTLSGELSFNKLEGLQKLKTGKSRTQFTMDVHDRSLTRTRATVKSSVQTPSLKGKGTTLNLGELKFDGIARMDLKSGNVDIDLARLEVPSLVTLDAKGLAQKWGETFALESQMTQLQLDALWKTLPESVTAGFKGLQLGGTASMNLSARGNKPAEGDFKSLNIPLEVRGDLTLSRAALQLPAKQLKVEDINYSGNVGLKDNNLKASGRLSLGKVFKKDLLGDSWLEPEFAFSYDLTNWNKLTVEKHQVAIENLGATHSVSGRVEGLKAFFAKKAPLTAEEICKRLDMALAVAASLKMAQTKPVSKDIRTDGEVSARATVKLAGGREIALDGEAAFNHFNASVGPSIKVKDVDGKFLFDKKFFLDRKLAGRVPEPFAVSEKGFFNQLRDFSRYKNILRIGALEFGPYKASDMGMDLLYKGNRLAAEKFIFDVLKGSVGGQFFLVQTQQGPALNFSAEFAGLDFNELAGVNTAGNNGKSQIDGNLQLGFKAGVDAGEKISIDQISAKIAVTRIGEEVADRILMFLDPAESKPAIAETRARLKLASPHRISIGLENGNLSEEIWLKSDLLGGIVKAPELKRVPVSSLKQYQDVSEQLQKLGGVKDLLRYLAARGFEFDEKKGVVLF